MSHPERIVPDETEPGIVALHLKRYDFALPFCAGKEVLDAGCGVGYGAAHLARAAHRVVGVDRDPETVEYARRRYGSARIEFLQADLLDLPLASESFDTACSFETIEHVPDPEALVAQLRRVTRPGGTCLVSTPRVDETTRNPENPFHAVELSAADLERLLRSHFGEVTLYGQRRLQSARHRTMQRLDPLGLRKRLTFLRPASRLLGTPPMAEVSLDEIEITEADVDGATEISRGLPVKVVHLVIGGDVAGGQAVALRLARALRADGGEALFVAPERGPFTELAKREGFGVHLVELRRSFELAGVWRLARLLRRERADVLHTHTLAAGNALSRLGGRAAGVPVVSHLHIENHFRGSTRALVARLDNATARLAAALVAVSEDTKSAYERQGYPVGRIRVIYNGVELPQNGSMPANDPPVIGEIARYCDVKGQRELIQALAEVPGTRLVLAGRDLERGGAFQAELEREAERMGVRDRLELGFREDVAALLDELDVVALPSWTEGLPMSLLEAMAHGRPVVATAVGGTPEVVADGETGLLVPPRDPAALAAALRRLLADPELRRQFGEAGRRRVAERFTARAMEEKILELYGEVTRA